METTATKQAKDDPISDGYVLAHNADRILRELIFTRRKALLDYGNDIAVAEARGYEKGLLRGWIHVRLEERLKGEPFERRVAANMRKNGFTEEQIRSVLGEGY